MPQELNNGESIIGITQGTLFQENEYIRYENNTLIFKDITSINEKIQIYNGELSFNGNKVEYINSRNTSTQIANLKIVFENCTIKEDFLVKGFLRNNLTFKQCTISTITFDKVEDVNQPNAPIGNIEFNNCVQINTLKVSDGIFRGKFYINPLYSQEIEHPQALRIDNIIIKNSVFENNFKLHHCDIKNFTMYGTDFMKKADFYQSILNIENDDKLSFKGINFYDLALFGDTKFEKFVQFKYVTFQGYAHFRKAVFKEGLDLEYANIEKEMNFFGIEINSKSKKTTQETYRIIKYQLNKVGSIIDANKYHARELHEKWRSLKLCSKDFFEWWVFLFHLISSNHSRWWFLSFAWICVIGAGTAYLLDNEIYDNFKTILTWCFLQDTIKYMSITSFDTIKDNPIVFFFNKVSLGYLYYQFLTAIRKDTRQ